MTGVIVTKSMNIANSVSIEILTTKREIHWIAAKYNAFFFVTINFSISSQIEKATLKLNKWWHHHIIHNKEIANPRHGAKEHYVEFQEDSTTVTTYIVQTNTNKKAETFILFRHYQDPNLVSLTNTDITSPHRVLREFLLRCRLKIWSILWEFANATEVDIHNSQ